MKKYLSYISALAILGTALTFGSDAQAMPLPAKHTVGSVNIETIAHRRGFYGHRNYYYYNGHRGYRYARPGYRYHRGYWFPIGAFAAGAVIGGAVASPPVIVRPAPGVSLARAHVNWCYNRYASYRAFDNTFQPYSGPRQLCYSPYG